MSVKSFYSLLFQGTFELKLHESIESVEAAKIKQDMVYLDISVEYWSFRMLRLC